MKRRQFQPPTRDGAAEALKKPFRVPALGHLANPTTAAAAATAPPPKPAPPPAPVAAAAPKPPPSPPGKCDAVLESLALAAASSYCKKPQLAVVATPSKGEAGDRAPTAPASSASEEVGGGSASDAHPSAAAAALPASPVSVQKASHQILGPAPVKATAAPKPALTTAQAASPRPRAAAPPAPSAVKCSGGAGGGSPLIYVPRLPALPINMLATLEAAGLNAAWPDPMQIMGGLRQLALPAAADLPFAGLAATAAALEGSILPQAVPLQEARGAGLACLRQKVAEEALHSLPGFGSASRRPAKASPPLKKLAMTAPKPPLLQPCSAAGHSLPHCAPPAAATAVLAPKVSSKPVSLKPAAAHKLPPMPAPGWDKHRVQQRLAESSAIPLSFLRAILFA